MPAVKVSGEFLVNTETNDDQSQPTVTGLAGGGFVVSWSDRSGVGGDTDRSGVKAQIFDAAGARVGNEFLVNTVTLGTQWQPTVTGLAGGGFVVSWSDTSGVGGDIDGAGVKAQIFDAAGARVGNEFLVNTETQNPQWQPAITGLADGGFVVSWPDFSGVGDDTSGAGVKAQIFDAAGAKVGNEFLVNTETLNDQSAQTVTALAGGGFVVSWSDRSRVGGDTSSTGVKAQIFDAAGVRVGGEFLVNTVTLNGQFEPTVTGLAGGGFVVSWMDLSGVGGDDSVYSIKAQLFDATGAKVDSEFLVNTETAEDQYQSTITGLADGRFVVSWVDSSGVGNDISSTGIKAQIFELAPPDTTAPLAPTVSLARDTGSSGTDRVTNDGTLSVAPAEPGGTVEYSTDDGVTYSSTAPGYARDGSADGPHRLLVRQLDAAGNASPATTFDFVLDSTAPAAGVTSARLIQPAGGGEILRLAGTVEQSAGTTVQVFDGGTDLGAALLDGDGRWSFSASLTAGSHDIQLFARDLAGNLSQLPVTPTSNAAPTGELTASGSLVRGQTLAGGHTLADADGLGPLRYQWQRADAAGQYSDIAGASQDSYLLTRDDIGHSLRLVATYLDGAGSTETVTGAGTVPVAARGIAVQRIAASDVSRPVEAMTSSDVAARLADGDVLAPAAGTSQLRLADGLIHYAADSGAAYLARLYHGLLGRAGEDGGLSFWTHLTGPEPDRLLVAKGFLDSPEYQARQPDGTNAEFVDSLYRGLLGREAEDAGRAYFLDLLTQGASRAAVLMSVADAAEAREYWAPLTAAGVFVPGEDSGLIRASYAAAFGREAEAGGLVFFNAVLATGLTPGQLGDLFADTAEFRSAHDGQSDHDFVASLYRNGLGRDGSETEIGFYESLLASHAADRGDVLMAFATSAEGQAHLQWSL